jgi:RNA-directed DNA polymerase
MRLPQPLLDSPFFQFERLEEFERALSDDREDGSLVEVRRLAALGLPPIASPSALATLLGVNQGIIWSFVHRTQKHYRTFSIPKGRDRRQIDAPRVALKVVQKWLATQLGRKHEPQSHVYGFVPGKSHLDAAMAHTSANWVLSLDIENFFPSTPQGLVEQSLINFGFGEIGAKLIASLTCLRGNLAQGAPTSPVLSNICFAPWDDSLARAASQWGVRVTRYADDVVFSGTAEYPDGLLEAASALLSTSPWRLSERKICLAVAPARRKVHGLLVHGDCIRLTKGYRNRLRAYRHLLATRSNLESKFREKALGHIAYQDAVEQLADST